MRATEEEEREQRGREALGGGKAARSSRTGCDSGDERQPSATRALRALAHRTALYNVGGPLTPNLALPNVSQHINAEVVTRCSPFEQEERAKEPAGQRMHDVRSLLLAVLPALAWQLRESDGHGRVVR